MAAGCQWCLQCLLIPGTPQVCVPRNGTPLSILPHSIVGFGGVRWIWICGPDFKSHASLSDPGHRGICAMLRSGFGTWRIPSYSKTLVMKKRGNKDDKVTKSHFWLLLSCWYPDFEVLSNGRTRQQILPPGSAGYCRRSGATVWKFPTMIGWAHRPWYSWKLTSFLVKLKESSGYSHIAYDIAEGQENMGWVTSEIVWKCCFEPKDSPQLN